MELETGCLQISSKSEKTEEKKNGVQSKNIFQLVKVLTKTIAWVQNNQFDWSQGLVKLRQKKSKLYKVKYSIPTCPFFKPTRRPSLPMGPPITLM